MMSNSCPVSYGLVILISLFVISLSNAGLSFPASGPPFTGIDGLDIGGTLYDVRFQDTSFDALFVSRLAPTPTPTFWGDQAGAEAAAAAIAAHFNTFSLLPTDLGPDPATSALVYQILVPFRAVGMFSVDPWVAAFFSSLGTTWSETNVGTAVIASVNEDASMIATFTPSTTPIPLPGALCLALTGVMSVAGYYRNRSHSA